MPNLQNGMTGDKLIEEVNSALDKRGNPDGSGTQNILGSIRIDQKLEAKEIHINKDGLVGKISPIQCINIPEFHKEDLIVNNNTDYFKQIYFEYLKETSSSKFVRYFLLPPKGKIIRKGTETNIVAIKGTFDCAGSNTAIYFSGEYDIVNKNWLSKPTLSFPSSMPIAYSPDTIYDEDGTFIIEKAGEYSKKLQLSGDYLVSDSTYLPTELSVSESCVELNGSNSPGIILVEDGSFKNIANLSNFSEPSTQACRFGLSRIMKISSSQEFFNSPSNVRYDTITIRINYNKILECLNNSYYGNIYIA